MKERLNCPNCGAAITGATCEYCGTVFYDFANIKLNEPSYIRLKLGDVLHIFRAIPFHVEVKNVAQTMNCLYCDDVLVERIVNPCDYELTLTMRIIPDDRGVLLEKHKRELI